MPNLGGYSYNCFGGGDYQPPDTKDLDPDEDGCPECGGPVWDDDGAVHCSLHGWFDYAGRKIEEGE